MDMLTVGNTVTIKVKNPLWHTRDRGAVGVIGSEFNEYTGTVIKQKWFKNDEIGLTTGDEQFPFRVININRIVEVSGVEVDYSIKNTETITKVVQGSKGATYIVTKNGNNSHCTCPGFGFRKHCRHIQEVLA